MKKLREVKKIRTGLLALESEIVALYDRSMHYRAGFMASEICVTISDGGFRSVHSSAHSVDMPTDRVDLPPLSAHVGQRECATSMQPRCRQYARLLYTELSAWNRVAITC